MAASIKQKEYQQKYDKKTKMISVKYVKHDMDDYDRFEYNYRFRFIDITENENPDLLSPESKIFYANSATLQPWIE